MNASFLKRLRENDVTLVSVEYEPGLFLTKEEIKDLVAAAKNNTNLNTLIMNENDIDDEDIKYLISLKNVTTLSLSTNNISDIGVNKIISNMPRLEKLMLGGNNIGDAGATCLANSNLTLLDLYGNHITDQGAKKFINNHSLLSLRLSLNEVSKETLEEIDRHIKDNRNKK